MVQGGDYQNFDGSGGEAFRAEGDGGGSGSGGRFLPDENFVRTHDRAGVVSMANRGKDTAGSQFFITLGRASHLDGKHVAFGSVSEGMDVVMEMGGVETDDGERPVAMQKIVITDCGTVDEHGRCGLFTAGERSESSSVECNEDDNGRHSGDKRRKKRKKRKKERRRDGDDDRERSKRRHKSSRSSSRKSSRRCDDTDTSDSESDVSSSDGSSDRHRRRSKKSSKSSSSRRRRDDRERSKKQTDSNTDGDGSNHKSHRERKEKGTKPDGKHDDDDREDHSSVEGKHKKRRKKSHSRGTNSCDHHKSSKRSRRHYDSSSSSSNSHDRRRRRDTKTSSHSKKRNPNPPPTAPPPKTSARPTFGAYGILKQTDIHQSTRAKLSFETWMAEVKGVPQSSAVAKWEMTEYTKEYVEDFNTATLPHVKYYDYGKWETEEYARRKGEAITKKGPQSDEFLHTEEMRRNAIEKKRKEMELVKSTMNRGKVKEMKRQAGLKAELENAYRVGDQKKVKQILRRLEPDEKLG